MIFHIELKTPSGTMHLDTPDWTLVGPWISAFFTEWRLHQKPRIPIEFQVTVS